jgi:hypothetical protein
VRACEWAEDVYRGLRSDPELVPDLVRTNPGVDPADIERAVKHVLHDEHTLGGGMYGPEYRGRFDAGPDNAEAWLRLRDGRGTSADHVMLRHEIAEAAYVDSHPGAAYSEAHAHANSVANWEAILMGRDG